MINTMPSQKKKQKLHQLPQPNVCIEKIAMFVHRNSRISGNFTNDRSIRDKFSTRTLYNQCEQKFITIKLRASTDISTN